MSIRELRPELVRTVGHIAARWPRADTEILKYAFPLLAEGRPVSVSRLAQAAGTSSEAVEQTVVAGRVELDDNGDIGEVFGVTLKPTLHRVEHEQAVLFTCCAVVVHVLPRLLGREIEVASEDPVTGDRVRLVIAPEGVRSVEPDTAVASMVLTDKSNLQQDAPLHFCRHVHHFRSGKTAAVFAAEDASRYGVTIAELDELARRVYSEVWS